MITPPGRPPVTSGVSLSPNPSNGSAPVTVAATGTSTGSTVATAEYTIDGGAATPIPVATPAPAVSLTATISAATVAALADGSHTVAVRAQDVLGNWGATASATLIIERTAPTFTGIALTPNSVPVGTAGVSVAVIGATDPLVGGFASGVAGGEWWIGATNIAAGTGTGFNGLAATVATGSLAPGTQTVRVRIRDAAGNWSTGTGGVRTAILTVAPPDAIFSDGYETGTLSPLTGWSSRSTTTTSRLNVTAAAALVGTYGLQAQGAATNYVQYNFGTAANPATASYDARFYFNPNGNASTGQDILAAATSSTFGTQLFHVRYRRNGTQPQVQAQVRATANASWVNVTNNAGNRVEVVWQSGGTLQLFVNGNLSQTLTAGTGAVAAVRLGAVTSGGGSTLEYFDAFASRRSVSPLIGP